MVRLEKRKSVNFKMLSTLIFLVMGLVPLVVHVKSLEFISPEIDSILAFQTKDTLEMFTYYKFILLVIIGIFLLAVFTYKLFLTDRPLTARIVNILLTIFSFSLLFSALFSDYKTFALFGAHNRHMGVLAYLCFVLLMFVIVNTPDLKKYVRYSFYVLMPLTVINAFLVLLDFFKLNILDIDLINLLIMENYEVEAFRGTLNHPNYMSGMGAVLFAFFAAGMIFKSKDNREKRLFLVMTACSSIIIYGAKSLSGVVTLIFSLILLVGIITGYRDKKMFFDLGKITLALVLVFVLMGLYDSSFIKELSGDSMVLALSLLSGLLLAVICYLLIFNKQLSKKSVVILPSVMMALVILFGFMYGEKVENKINQELAKIDSVAIQQKLELDEFDLPEHGVVWGTGRLYLWKETIELCLNKPFLGYGLDTLAYEFNQGDPAKIAALDDERVNVNKPHSIYLNMWYGAGIISLLAYLAIIGCILIRSVKFLLRRNSNSTLVWPFLFGILAYLYQGLFNDSIQGFEALLWIFLGFTYLLGSEEIVQEVKR